MLVLECKERAFTNLVPRGRDPFGQQRGLWERDWAFTEKVNSRCLLIFGGHIGAPKRYTNMASPYKALQGCVNLFGK